MPRRGWSWVALTGALCACQCGEKVTGLTGTLSAQPALLDFGVVPVATAVSRSATLTAERGPVVLEPAVLDAPEPTLSIGEIAGELDSSTTRPLVVTWLPTAAGELDDWLTVPSDASSPDVRLHLVGRATLCVDGDADGAGLGPSCTVVDCNDADSLVRPSAPERCNGVDDDCDQTIDEDGACPAETCNGTDDDRDGFVDEDGVCPPETCNGVDDDQDGLVDEGGVCGGTAELCNGLDDDANGVVDDVPGAGTPCASAVGGPGGLNCTSAGRLACNTFSGQLDCRLPQGNLECGATCGGTAVTVRVDPYFRGEAPGMVFQNPPGSGYSRPITVTFTPPVPRVSIACVDPDFTGNDATAFDAQGAVVDHKVFAGDGMPGTQPPNIDVQQLNGQPGRDIARVVLTPDPLDYVGYSAIGVCP